MRRTGSRIPPARHPRGQVAGAVLVLDDAALRIGWPLHSILHSQGFLCFFFPVGRESWVGRGSPCRSGFVVVWAGDVNAFWLYQ